MRISYFATLRAVTHRHEEDWPRPAATVGALVQDLVDTYGRDFARWVLPDGRSPGLAILLVNGVDVRSLQGLDTPLQPGDSIFIFPPVAGG